MKNNGSINEEKVEKIKTICIIILSIILLINIIIGICSITNGGKFGFYSLRFFIMTYDSEETGTSTGDLVVANKTMPKWLKEDETIIYKKNNSMTIKKIEKIENSGDDVSIYVLNEKKNADNVVEKEYEKIENKQIMGKYLFKNRGIGNMAMFIKSPLGKINLLLVILCIFIIAKKIIEKNKEKIIS